MVLVNGSDGIGTGWSSSIPNYNPADIVANLKRKLLNEELEPMHPWYRGFNVSRILYLSRLVPSLRLTNVGQIRVRSRRVRKINIDVLV
jgi:DNA gyrase/topoisomerase IV subunit A